MEDVEKYSLDDYSYVKKAPNLDYKSITLTYVSDTTHTIDVGLSGTCRATIGTHNYFTISFIPNVSLTYYEVRITKASDDYDIGVGTRAYSAENLPANKAHTFNIALNADNFSAGATSYRISLYAKNQRDYSWDVSYLFFTTDGLQFIVQTDEAFESLTAVDKPVL